MSIWDRVIALLLRDHTMFRAMEEHILGNPGRSTPATALEPSCWAPPSLRWKSAAAPAVPSPTSRNRASRPTGVDLSPRMVQLAGDRWAPLGVRIVQGKILG
jgi:hypothetical protein